MAATGSKWKGNTIWPEIKEVLQNNDTIVIYDLETTGLSSAKDSIIEIAAIKFHVDSAFQMTELDTLHQYINPGRPLPEKIVEITHITDEFLADKPSMDEVYPDIVKFFGTAVVGGYNIITFDNKFMGELFAAHGDFFRPAGSVDGIRMARNRLSSEDVENYKLATVGAYYGFDFNAHSAIEDARTVGKVIQQLINEYVQAEATATDEPKTGANLRPTVRSVAFWPGFRGFSRIYLDTDMGTVYYDIRSQSWGGKDVDVAMFDMEYIEQEAFRMTGTSNEAEFAKFTGNIRVAS